MLGQTSLAPRSMGVWAYCLDSWKWAWHQGLLGWPGQVPGSTGVILELGPIGVGWGYGGQPGAGFCGIVSAYFTVLPPSEAYLSIFAGKVMWVM